MTDINTPDKFSSGQIILINKPYKWTSFQAVNKVKWLIKKNLAEGRRQLTEGENPKSQILTSKAAPRLAKGKTPKLKVGHAGTLDPLATGLLIICTGKFTKRIAEFQAMEKEYTGTFFIGATTPCFDMEKEVDKHFSTEHITPELLHQTTERFKGKIFQTPPIFSAVKVAGERAYDIARRGETAEIKSKEITIKEFEITRIAFPEVDFKVVCSKGTYIRSLARDFGEALNSGAYLFALCRTRIGDFNLKDAMSIEEFENSL